jgi:hypothetical protein
MVPRTEITGLDLERLCDIWIFTLERIWTQDASGPILNSRSELRGAYKDHVRASKWDQLHLAYFAGYAFWNYVCILFALAEPGFEIRELPKGLRNSSNPNYNTLSHL